MRGTSGASSRNGVHETGLDRVIAPVTTCSNSHLFNVGRRNCAWTPEKGFKAPQAAGEIHTEFERGSSAENSRLRD